MAKKKSAKLVDLERPDLIEHVVSRATEEANKRILEREGRRHRYITLALAVLGLTGVTSANFLIETTITRKLETEVNKQLDAKIDLDSLREEFAAIEVGIRDQAAVFSLQSLSNRLEAADAFNLAEEKQVLEELEKISKSETAMSSPALTLILQQVIEAFIAADRIGSIETLDESFRSTILGNEALVPQVCTASAQEIVGGPSSAGREPNATLFQVYCDATFESGFPEVGLLWRMVAAHKDAAFVRNDTVETLIAQVPLLTPIDLEAFQRLLTVFSDPANFVSVENPQAVAVAKTVKSLLSVYPELTEIQSTRPEADPSPSMN